MNVIWQMNNYLHSKMIELKQTLMIYSFYCK